MTATLFCESCRATVSDALAHEANRHGGAQTVWPVETATYILDADAYVAHGAFGGQDTAEWAEQFRATGGKSCTILPKPADASIVMFVTGTPETLDFVDATVGA